MRDFILTSDNLHLSQAKNGGLEGRVEEGPTVNCTNISFTPVGPQPLTEAAADLLRHSLAANTERAYASDLRHFRDWGGVLPAPPAMICAYIAEHAGSLSVATMRRRIATLSKAHEAANLPNPCRSEVVKATLQGLRRKHGTAQRQARPLLRDDLFAVLDKMGDSLKDTRDRALLLLGFAGGFRRSELVGLDVGDVEIVRQGLIVTLRRSTTDHNGAGRQIGIPFGRTRHCPVLALEAWLAASGSGSGPLFRPITRHGQIEASQRLSGDAVACIVRERLIGAGISPDGFSGHSLRAGFATSPPQQASPTTKSAPKLATPRMPCWPATSAQANCSKAMRRGLVVGPSEFRKPPDFGGKRRSFRRKKFGEFSARGLGSISPAIPPSDVLGTVLMAHWNDGLCQPFFSVAATAG